MTTKQIILQTLNNQTFTSGEELANLCNVSRMAVNKAINSLRESGFIIEAITNKGYRIVCEPDKISAQEINNIIEELGGNAGKIFAFDTIDSTNTEAKRQCASVGAFRNLNGQLTDGGTMLHRALFVSGHQTAGRGRMGRKFESPKDSGIYFTLIFSPKNGVTNPALLTAAAAVAVSKTIDKLYETNSKIKWVNDIFVSDKKVSGILTEGISNFETGRIESAIVGIGINVRNDNFKGDLAKLAGSIENLVESKRKVSRNEIVANVIFHLLNFYDNIEKESSDSEPKIKEMIDEYRDKSLLTGKTVTINTTAGLEGEKYLAKVIGISESAELIVETENGEQKFLHSGEVSLHSYDFL